MKNFSLLSSASLSLKRLPKCIIKIAVIGGVPKLRGGCFGQEPPLRANAKYFMVRTLFNCQNNFFELKKVILS